VSVVRASLREENIAICFARDLVATHESIIEE
jgi:hypothetical protein